MEGWDLWAVANASSTYRSKRGARRRTKCVLTSFSRLSSMFSSAQNLRLSRTRISPGWTLLIFWMAWGPMTSSTNLICWEQYWARRLLSGRPVCPLFLHRQELENRIFSVENPLADVKAGSEVLFNDLSGMLLAADTRRLVLPGWLSLVRPRKGNHSAGLITSMWEIRKSRVRKHLCPRLPPPALSVALG